MNDRQCDSDFNMKSPMKSAIDDSQRRVTTCFWAKDGSGVKGYQAEDMSYQDYSEAQQRNALVQREVRGQQSGNYGANWKKPEAWNRRNRKKACTAQSRGAASRAAHIHGTQRADSLSPLVTLTLPTPIPLPRLQNEPLLQNLKDQASQVLRAKMGKLSPKVDCPGPDKSQRLSSAWYPSFLTPYNVEKF